MQLPVHTPDSTRGRPSDEVRAMALAVQANLYQLKVADARRRGLSPQRHEISVPSPGAVLHYRETLIDREHLADYAPEALLLRLHEIWGQFCLMRWVFSVPATTAGINLAVIEEGARMHCEAALEAKLAEVHAIAWRIQFEQRLRHDPDAGSDPALAAQRTTANTIPARIFGKPVDSCSDEEILLGACEHAGLLATIRWIHDRRWTWAQPGIMDIAESPF